MKLPFDVAAAMSRAGSASRGWKIDLVALAACAVLTGVGYVGGARPLLNSRDDHTNREAALFQARDSAASLAANARVLRSQLSNAQLTLARLEIQLLSASQLNQRIAELTALAASCGLEVQYVQPGAIASGQRYAQLPIQVSGTGSYRNCAKFLHQLRLKLPDTAVRAFELSSSPADVNAQTSFNFQLLWYVQPGNDAAKR